MGRHIAIESRRGLLYPASMIRILVAILLATSAASAGVYKWVDSQGRTQFSDRPRPDAEAVELTPSPPKAAAVAARPAAGPSQAAQLGPYSQFDIISPEANQTLRQTPDDLSVSLIVDPPLSQEHRLEIVLDGTPIAVERSVGMQVKVTGVPFGSHMAQAQILDSQGEIVARTPVVPFHLRKPIPPGVLQ